MKIHAKYTTDWLTRSALWAWEDAIADEMIDNGDWAIDGAWAVAYA